MLSKKKKRVSPLNPLKPERWFAFYKERLRHHGVQDSAAGAGADGVGNSACQADEQTYWTEMKGDESNRPASAGKLISDSNPRQIHSSKSNNHKVELVPCHPVAERITQVVDPRWQREPEIRSTSSDASSFRPVNSGSNVGATKLTVTRHVRRSGAGPTPVRARSSGSVSMEQSPPVREEGSCAGASQLVMENGRAWRGYGGKMSNRTNRRYAGAVETMAGPSCSEQSSSESSDDDDDAQSKAASCVPLEKIGSSCSPSGSKSPSSLQRRVLDMHLELDHEYFRRDHRGFEYFGDAPALRDGAEDHQQIGVQAGLVGLYNDGNTCYLNSCLQCLAHTLPLASAVLGPYSDQILKNGARSRHGDPERERVSATADALTYEFHLIVRDLWRKPPGSVASASNFLQCVQALAPQFAGSFQHDAQEVLRVMLDGLHEALNWVKVATPYRDLYVDQSKPEVELADLTWEYHKSSHDSIIQTIFCGQLQSTIECSVCHRKSHCFDPFMDLSLPLPKSSDSSPPNSREFVRNSMHHRRVTILDCLSEFGAPEQLEGSDPYYCPNCKASRTSTKKLSLFRLPPVLVLHIKRFYEVDRNTYTKDDTPVSYPLQGLDVSNLMGSKARKVQGHVYDLYAVCCHMGSMGCGHYIAQCTNSDNNVWYCFNDSSVQPVQDAAVLSSSAYILFYQQRPL